MELKERASEVTNSKLPRRAAQMVQLLSILNAFGIPECVCSVYISKFTKNKVSMFV